MESPYSFVKNLVIKSKDCSSIEEKARILDFIFLRHENARKISRLYWDYVSIQPPELQIVHDALVHVNKLYYNSLLLGNAHPDISYGVSTYMLGVVKLLELGIERYRDRGTNTQIQGSTTLDHACFLSKEELLQYAALCLNHENNFEANL